MRKERYGKQQETKGEVEGMAETGNEGKKERTKWRVKTEKEKGDEGKEGHKERRRFFLLLLWERERGQCTHVSKSGSAAYMLACVPERTRKSKSKKKQRKGWEGSVRMLISP